MTRLLVRQAEFDGAVRLLTADIARTDPDGAHRRAVDAVALLYVLPSPGDVRTPPASRLDAAASGAGAPVGRPLLDSRPAAPNGRTQR